MKFLKHKVFYLFLIFCTLCILLFSCKRQEKQIILPADSLPQIILPDPLWIQAQEIAASMNDNLLAAQVIITGIDGRGYLPLQMKELLGDIPAGGVMLFRQNLNTDNNSIRALIAETSTFIAAHSGIPPFVAVDHEGGTVNRLRRGVADLPAARYYWDTEQEGAVTIIRQDSYKAGLELASLGFNMNFAPVAEYLNDDNRDFLYSRSYSSNPVFTAKAAAAFLYGMKDAGIICVVKHFPGSAGKDPHYSASIVNLDIDSLQDLTLADYVYPFSFLISSGARAVMAAHTIIPAIDNKVASLSSVVMNDLLRSELGFNGIIIADDFNMAAAGNMRPEIAAAASVAAGADMVMVWPADLRRTHTAFITAINNGTLPRERLEEAVSRIIYEKSKSMIYLLKE
ncbi:MAG: glycoside hydrolase family 3 protein [Treponema sp.]|jgi:beta-N-acetylhexosaminidase|nr:glycoside hydrolase family 3 protein [Treponema sp.]